MILDKISAYALDFSVAKDTGDIVSGLKIKCVGCAASRCILPRKDHIPKGPYSIGPIPNFFHGKVDQKFLNLM